MKRSDYCIQTLDHFPRDRVQTRNGVRTRVRSGTGSKRKVCDFWDVVDAIAQSLRTPSRRQPNVYALLNANHIHLPWEQSDAQIQAALYSLPDDLQYKIQEILHPALVKAYVNRLPDCGGMRGINSMLGLMNALTSLELSLGIEECAAWSSSQTEPYWFN